MKQSICPIAKKCGGCQLQNLSYRRQLQHKQVQIIKLLGKYHHVNEIIGMEHPTHYRHKVQAAFAMRGEHLVSGIYQSSTGTVLPVDSCMIQNPAADAIILTIRRLLPSFHIRAYEEKTGRGHLRHVLIRKGYATGQIMVVLVTAAWEVPHLPKFVRALLSHHPEITTVVQNVNDTSLFLALGEESRTLYGEGAIEDELCGLRFRLSPRAFYQVNPQQTEILYQTALSFAGLDGSQTVLDAYCGTGTIGLLAAKQAKRVIGVELNGDAVRDAWQNARQNNIENVEFIEADAGKYMVQAAKSHETMDVVLMDPPRAGASRAFLQSLITLSPKRIVYISCNPATQARDLGVLVRAGYRVRKIQPVDLFPYTSHVETVILLSKGNQNAQNPITYLNPKS